MVLDRLFGRDMGLGEGEYIELDTEGAEGLTGKIPIKVDKIDEFSDADRIQRAVRDGAIVLCKIKSLKEKDISELKRAIEKLRKTCIALNGDIAGIDEDFIIICPSFAHVTREA